MEPFTHPICETNTVNHVAFLKYIGKAGSVGSSSNLGINNQHLNVNNYLIYRIISQYFPM